MSHDGLKVMGYGLWVMGYGKTPLLITHDSSFVTRHSSPITHHPSPITHHSSLTHRGFTYIGLLIVLAVMGTTLAAAGVVWHTEAQRAKEGELLHIGDQFRRAIGRYYERTPGAAKGFPQSLEELVRDKRYPGVQRYLRRIYVDPMTGKAEWGLIKGPGGAIIGVHSLSEQKPLKTSGFKLADVGFADKERYAEWEFVYQPAPIPQKPPAGAKPVAEPPGAAPAGDAEQSPRATRRRRRSFAPQ